MRLPLIERLGRVRAEGDYVASRVHGGHQVHLYAMDGFFCEVWMRAGHNAVEWIELAGDPGLLSGYVKLDPEDLL
jgi:hypothetical protein